MALKILWSKRADKKFDKILDYLQEDFGESVTKSFVRKVYDFLDILSEFPELGSIENREKKIRGFTIVKNINIFYQIDDKAIYLLDFFDNRQSLKKKNL
jgi:plasmid stabilization system protein ParE